MRDYYEILGVTRTIDEAGLKSAFRKLAMEHHPDRNGGCENAAGRFKEINEAYSVLSDPQKRAAYDRFGHAGVNGPQGGPGGFGGQGFDASDIFNDVFGDVFGEMFGGGRRQSNAPQRGQDLRYDLEITLEQAYAGAEVEITVPAAMTCEVCEGSGAKPGTSPSVCGTCGGAGRVRATQGFFAVERGCPRCGGSGRLVLDPCSNCHGHGQVRRERILSVRIPAGVDDGARIRLAGEGDAGARGGPRGDLYIFLSVTPHELFERDGLDLLCTVPVPMTTAALGGEIDAPCLLGGESCDGECKVKVHVPEGAQTGKTVRLKGKGMPSLRSRQRGDLVVELFVETPTHLSARQKELMRELAGLCGEKQNPKSANFVGKAKRFWEEVTGS
ncbi:molecular chaperone DnaJ [Caulobacter vibrioides]|uniref:Chaperone protein DnaJ n=2 Tax=Caulobacter vibrioides TaxID=155892 RepID=DNAJ_CAUVC|nr:molecular chaperone DnaJ [Caulobacter vibrioides]YP_002515386.1 chaperone protein DnaJ [Caulobacter vibrioides NA1000]P22305.2 RecName: Full=Chaperone protein DnaJ [Caulobacter vibrioides CB15]AAK21999.1 dnaJ protein [Caulobacter vibrioides CB15]ACL93478.1 chaperone protein DnaJ [Caulobacter vibrioides NA1000]ATC26849.1 molecular chaperone DnaJ [Caulobacter vibrioides]QXZ52107.1 molecular chaperone DnaJ [Caulobacter vibrioides]